MEILKFSKKDNEFVQALLKFHQKQKGIFRIEDLANEMKIHRTQADRIISRLKKIGSIKEISSKEVKELIGKKDERCAYYKADLESEFARWHFDNKRAIALEVLVRDDDLREEAKQIIKKLKSKIKTKSILEELKVLQLI